MCFNPAKNYQLTKGASASQQGGWYDDSHIVELDSGNWTGKLIGVAEYDNNPTNDPIIIKLVSGGSGGSGGGDWFIGFNRAIGPNADNVQADDEVTIYTVTNGNGYGYSTSSLKGTIRSGQSAVITNWNNGDMDMIIKVNEINTMARPGYAQIDITLGEYDQPPPSPAPGGPGLDDVSDWFASLSPGGAVAVLFFGTLLLCTCFYACFYSTKFCMNKRRSVNNAGENMLYFNDKQFNLLGNGSSFSHVGASVYATLQQKHSRHQGAMWNVTSGKIRSLDYTPTDVWDTSLYPRNDPLDEGVIADEWLPSKIEEIIGRTQHWWYVSFVLLYTYIRNAQRSSYNISSSSQSLVPFPVTL